MGEMRGSAQVPGRERDGGDGFDFPYAASLGRTWHSGYTLGMYPAIGCKRGVLVEKEAEGRACNGGARMHDGCTCE